MPKFLVQVNYSAEGARGLHAEGGTKRQQIVAESAASVGGTLESMYFSFGKYDVVCVCEMPDAVAMAALSLAVARSGAGEVLTTPLLSVEEMDHAVSKPSAYRKPGL